MVERQVKVLIKIFFEQAVSADVISNSAVGIFSLKQKEQRHRQLGFTDKWLPHKFRSLKILGPLSNFKIQQKSSDTAETESEVVELSSWDQANRGEKLGLVL
jgi:hypothetical protein